MSTASKRKGSSWEIDVMNVLRKEYGEKVSRSAMAGVNDEGDLHVEDPDGLYIVIECKAEKEFNLAGYMVEALRERDNFARARGIDPKNVMPIAVVKAPRKSVHDAYVITPLREYFAK